MSESPYFQPTRWTLIAEANGPDRALARAALEKLCAAYWYPLYAYARRRGLSPEDAEDAVQGFFLQLLERDYFAAASRERGRLRSFLIHQIDCWLADAARRDSAKKRGGGLKPLSIDAFRAEADYAAEPFTSETPESLYQKRWALTLVAGALRELEALCAADGQAAAFALLQPALTEPTAAAINTAAVAGVLGIPREQVRLRVHRLRARFREVLMEHVASTLHKPAQEELEAEMQALLAALRPGQ